MEMNPSDVGVYDRVIVQVCDFFFLFFFSLAFLTKSQEVIKEFARSQALDAVAYKVVILHEVDRMSQPAQVSTSPPTRLHNFSPSSL